MAKTPPSTPPFTAKGMPLSDILEDLIDKTTLETSHTHPDDSRMVQDDRQVANAIGQGVESVDELVRMLERECNVVYRDPGVAIHFVGLLLTVFVAELVSRYCERETSGETKEINGDGDGVRSRMLSCLYSIDFVAFVLSHPTKVLS